MVNADADKQYGSQRGRYTGCLPGCAAWLDGCQKPERPSIWQHASQLSTLRLVHEPAVRLGLQWL